jgi:tRNA (pseudouridine54-N1)-methyltransferase|tara:strand:- start:223 stop:834 length:612 start_codon:yes stop_codon:yes gene_type:complete
MREFIYFSSKAKTSGNFDTRELMKAGRMDIACQIIIMAFFVSHHTRENVKLHLVFNGPPDAPKHLEFFPGKNFMADDEERIDISKKDVAGLIKKMLYKYKKGEKREVVPGYFIEKKSILKIAEEFIENGKEIFILDKRGEDIRKFKTSGLKNSVFIIGDQDGLPKKELKYLKKISKKLSVGNQMYFASQTMTIIQNELDRREI